MPLLPDLFELSRVGARGCAYQAIAALRLLRRIALPIRPKPEISIAQVAGSGTAPFGALFTTIDLSLKASL